MNDALMNVKLSRLRQGFVDKALAAAVAGEVRLPVAPRETAWDGDAARARVFDTYDTPQERQRAFLWVEGDPEQIGSYHLGFADLLDGELTIIPRGVSAVRGALNGARNADMSVPPEAEARLAEIENRVRDELGDEETMLGDEEDD